MRPGLHPPFIPLLEEFILSLQLTRPKIQNGGDVSLSREKIYSIPICCYFSSNKSTCLIDVLSPSARSYIIASCLNKYNSFISCPTRQSGGESLGRREKLAQKVGRREIYHSVPPPSNDVKPTSKRRGFFLILKCL